jgi:DNA-binding CsgD family transcriptional regulator
LRNEQLRAEVNNKVKQLATSTLGAIRKNESLMKVKMELIRHRQDLESASGHPFFRRLLKVIDDNLGDQEDWSLFENNFDEAHENFIKRLKEKHPELSPRDLRFCAYLRMNLSSKEIASLLNVTVRGVEIRRYRLRKRLGLDHQQNLTAYLMDF